MNFYLFRNCTPGLDERAFNVMVKVYIYNIANFTKLSTFVFWNTGPIIIESLLYINKYGAQMDPNNKP